MKNIALVILAAGESKRMGQPKQLLAWGKTSLIQNAIYQADRSRFTDIYVVLGAYYDRIHPQVSNNNITILHHKHWTDGLGKSISYATKHISTLNYDGVLLMLADQPEADFKYLDSMFLKFTPNTNQIIANQYDHSFGVPVLFDCCYFNALIENQNSGAKQIISTNLNYVTPAPLSTNLMDIDTPEEYQTALLKVNKK